RVAQRLDILGRMHSAANGLLNNPVQSSIDIAPHPGRITANVKIRALLQPLKQLGGMFAHPVLNVEFLGLIARKRGREARQRTVAKKLLQFIAVEEVGGLMLVAEKEPRFPFGATRATVMQKGAEGRNPRAGANHD